METSRDSRTSSATWPGRWATTRSSPASTSKGKHARLFCKEMVRLCAADNDSGLAHAEVLDIVFVPRCCYVHDICFEMPRKFCIWLMNHVDLIVSTMPPGSILQWTACWSQFQRRIRRRQWSRAKSHLQLLPWKRRSRSFQLGDGNDYEDGDFVAAVAVTVDVIMMILPLMIKPLNTVGPSAIYHRCAHWLTFAHHAVERDSP